MTTTFNRSTIAIAGVLMQIALGAVYAWSVFRIPLTNVYGWTISEVTFAFELAIFVLGLASLAGGLWMRKTGPRPIALVAAGICQIGCNLFHPFFGRVPGNARKDDSSCLQLNQEQNVIGDQSLPGQDLDRKEVHACDHGPV